MTGSINMGSVWNSFGSGALSGGLSYGVGHLSGLTGIAKDIGHGISGGLQSMANGGNFGSGFAGGFVGSVAGGMSEGQGMFERAGIAGLAAGTTSWATGGDFATGFQSGFSKVLYNDFGEFTSKMMGDYLGRELSSYGQMFGNMKKTVENSVGKLLNNAGNLATAGQIVGKATSMAKIELRAQTIGRAIAVGQGVKAVADYKRKKISGQEALEQVGNAAFDAGANPVTVAIKSIFFWEVPIY